MSHSIIDAARALLSVCDGAKKDDKVGFNGVDSKFVRSIMSRRFLTKNQMDALHRILRKYRGQLSDHGIDYDALTIPAPGPQTSATGATVQAPAPKEAPPVEPPIEKAVRKTYEYCGPFPADDKEFIAAFPLHRFPEIRPVQSEALARIHKALFVDGKRFVILEAPTGTGKSNIGMTVARWFESKSAKTFFLTIQNMLIDQYLGDFPAPEIEFCKGRSNFPCTHPDAGPDDDAAHGVCKKKGKGLIADCLSGGATVRDAVQFMVEPSCHKCPYWEQLAKCVDNPTVLFNFSSFLFQRRTQRFPHASLLLIDEAHNIEGQMMSYVTLELTEFALDALDIKIDRPLTSKAQVVEWIREKEILKRIAEKIKGLDTASEEIAKDLSQAETDALRELEDKVRLFLQNLDKTDWLVSTETYKVRRETRKKILARPLYAKDFTDDLLFSAADKVLLMSATILDKEVYCENLGINLEDAEFVQIDCSFPPENRPIYMEYAGNMGHKYFDAEKNPTRPKFVAKIKEILKRHEGQKGIIHSHSFKLSKVLEEEVADPRFLFQGDFASKDEMLQEHARRTDSVIVAPAMHEGLDLKGDLGRFQIVAKVPYPSMMDKIIKERMSRDQKWYGWLTALKWVQELGRIIRSKDDWGTTYVVDQGFDMFAKMNARMIPGWIKVACHKGAPKTVDETGKQGKGNRESSVKGV